MKFALASALLLGASAASAQDANVTAYATGLVSALNANGLTALSGLVGRVQSRLLPILQANVNRNLTVLAPSNAAINALGNVDNDTLFNTVVYHILNGTFTANQSDSTVIANTGLSNSSIVGLPSNRSQVVVIEKLSNGTTYIKEPLNNVTFVANTTNGVQYQNLLVRPINSVLTIPGNLSALVNRAGLSSLASSLQQAQLLSTIASSKGLTIFAPTNAAFQAIQSTASTLNQTQLQAVLSQHVLNGTVAYSTLIPDSAVNAAGQTLKFTKNDTGVFVSIANSTAKITQTNVLYNNGVVHVIDTVLVDTATNTTAADSAFTSASTAPAPTSTPGNGNNQPGAAAPGAKVGAGLLGLTLVASAVFTLL
ncbi:hypothetical protein OC846_000886 [Tilletia horrida]|uniref:FAS1 domain-containing protein n=1 Tax=Tilletia horrida TaxID=155126 RepID=A0AAN6H009_9BASI|nr:hypothetical protein OC845_001160 [Tilletia horrida]KAK0556859.1 hypothetical protein OC846_000886 [Tilletia horrida]KAK0569207.1 hypothetical protein OC861_001133 [Tilletia horrida]